jgi:V-type H+-transporting ATPase subunit a
MGIFQACSFLVSSHGQAVSEERELEENVYSNGDFVETPFLFEQVTCGIPCCC